MSACGGSSNRQNDAYKTVVAYTTALQKREFYTACSMHSEGMNEGLGASISGGTGFSYTDTRACAVNIEAYEAEKIVLGGATAFDNMVVSPEPQGKAPKNGYSFKVTYAEGVVHIGVQRDSNGDWKIVFISG